MKRQFQLTIRNKQLLRAKVGQQIVMGVLSGTLFYQMDLAKAPPPLPPSRRRFLERLPRRPPSPPSPRRPHSHSCRRQRAAAPTGCRRAQSRGRCGRGEPSRGADVGTGEPSPGEVVADSLWGAEQAGPCLVAALSASFALLLLLLLVLVLAGWRDQ